MALASALALAACAVEPELGSNQDVGETFEEFRARTPRATEPPERPYIVEGDLALYGDDELRAYWEDLHQEGALAIKTSIWGSDIKWSSTAKLNLTYCINSNLVEPPAWQVREGMARAAREWEAAANVNFVHVPAQDGPGCTSANNNVVFNVSQVHGQQYSMKAFFPNESRSQRQLLINDGTYTMRAITGVLGHELGHVLGFRHEHIRNEAVTPPPSPQLDCEESQDYRSLTPYDSLSIMHYIECGGTATEFWWSQRDRVGAASVYGLGTHKFADILWRHTTGAMSIWLLNGAGNVIGSGGSSIAAGWDIVGNADINGDSHDDILWRHTDGTLSIWLMNGASTIGGFGYQVAPTTQFLGAADLDGDARAELMWRTGSTMTVWQLGGQGEFVNLDLFLFDAQHQAISPPSGRPLLGSGDLDGNGTADLVWGPRSFQGAPNDVVIWTMNLSQVTAVSPPIADTTGGAYVGTGDFNGDHRDEILRRRADNTLDLWFMNGISLTGHGTPPQAAPGWSPQGIADFNGDWRADILWRNPGGTTGIWYMDGALHVADGMPGTAGTDWTIRGVPRLD